jgi:hypothetical protein
MEYRYMSTHYPCGAPYITVPQFDYLVTPRGFRTYWTCVYIAGRQFKFCKNNLRQQTCIRFHICGHYDITACGQLLKFAKNKAACVLNQPYVRHT